MNEQEMIMNEKIRKREKLDTILAYILLVFLLGAILFILYLKFIKREDTTTPVEKPNNNITLNDISNSLNNSTLANRYLNDNVTFSSKVNGTSLVIDYKKDDKIVNLNVNTMGTELEFTMNEDNRLVTEDIYKEVANIICVYYKNTEDACRSTLSKVDENNPINGIRYVTSDNNILVYVNTAKSIDIENIDTYTEVTKTELSKTNYELKLDTETINNIKITNADTLITFTGNVTTTSESKNMSIVVTLYGDNDTKLTEEKYEFNDTNKLEENKEFKVEFTLNDTLTLDSIKAYSISIEK
ncbi:MAG: hypothetical protein SOT91_00395 [Bacilli bacterium]|nr:hypothetical protein [Clostridium sp.]MDY2803812.1 hypothetical protein [Bacilli bacterium]